MLKGKYFKKENSPMLKNIGQIPYDWTLTPIGMEIMLQEQGMEFLRLS